MVERGLLCYRNAHVFQYSLCRVVLMVSHILPFLKMDGELFQYSLCRVVLMVFGVAACFSAAHCLSVLALSSRFDGPGWIISRRMRC